MKEVDECLNSMELGKLVKLSREIESFYLVYLTASLGFVCLGWGARSAFSVFRSIFRWV